MSIELAGPGKRKQEPLVPEDKQYKFARIAKRGKEYERGEEVHLREEERYKNRAKTPDKIAIVSGAGALGLASIGAIPAAIGLGAVGLLAEKERRDWMKVAAKMAGIAQEARQGKEESYNESRSIVAEGMKADGAVEVNGQLQATPEQIEIARQEMIRKYGKKEK